MLQPQSWFILQLKQRLESERKNKSIEEKLRKNKIENNYKGLEHTAYYNSTPN